MKMQLFMPMDMLLWLVLSENNQHLWFCKCPPIRAYGLRCSRTVWIKIYANRMVNLFCATLDSLCMYSSY
jgi:hypothetical protein